jgi:multiple sugar transport system permease protein
VATHSAQRAGPAQAAARRLVATADWEAQRRRAFALGLAPALAVLAAITLGPSLYLFVTSLTPLNLVDPRTALDFSDPAGNYREALDDPRFVNSVWVQIKLSVATVALQLLVGLGVALLLNVRSRFLEAVRSAFLIPMVLPPIVVAIVWKVMYVTDVSPLHRALELVGLPISSLIANADTALWAIALAETWEWFPFTMLMVLAALQMIPNEPIEAAKIDGAGPLQLFRYVLLPYIRSTLVVAGLFRLIDSVKAFPLIYVLTNGGPGTVTEVTNYYAFVQAFNFSYWGYSSAIATLLVAGVLLLSWIIGRLGVDGGIDD